MYISGIVYFHKCKFVDWAAAAAVAVAVRERVGFFYFFLLFFIFTTPGNQTEPVDIRPVSSAHPP